MNLSLCKRGVVIYKIRALLWIKRISKKILEEILDRDEKRRIDLKEHLKNNFGETLCSIFFYPFLKKYYLKDLSEIIPYKDRGSIPIPDKEDVKKGYKGKKFDNQGYNAHFFYPRNQLKGFIDNYEKKVKKNIFFNEEVMKIDIDKKKVYTKTKKYSYSNLINTIPLKEFIYKINNYEDRFPEVKNLENISTLIVNMVLKKKKRRFHWIYIPQEKYPFYRVGFYPGRNPPVCYLERSIIPGTKYDKDEVKSDAEKTLAHLALTDEKDDILFMDVIEIPVSYIIFNRTWRRDVPELINKLKKFNIETTGRFGKWDYSSMSADIESAVNTADIVNRKQQ